MEGGRYGRSKLMFAGVSWIDDDCLGIALAFFPPKQITSLWRYEVRMFGVTLFFVGLAAFFFFVYGRRKVAKKIESGATMVVPL